MGGQKTTTTTQQNQTDNSQQSASSTNLGQSTTTPNMPSWLSQFYQGIPQQYQGLVSQLGSMAGKPLYGAPQIANYQQQLNQMFGQAGQDVNSQLAAHGALNSNRAGQAQTGLALGKVGQMGNFLAQIPQLNFNAQSSMLGQLGNTLANAQNFRPPIGQTTDSSQLMNSLGSLLSNSSMDSTQTTQQSGGLMQSLLGGLMSAGMSALTGGLSNVMGGGSLFGSSGGGPVSTMPASLSMSPAWGNNATSGPFTPPPFKG